MRMGESTSLNETKRAAIPPKRKISRRVARAYHSATRATPNQRMATTICGQARDSAKRAYCMECLQFPGTLVLLKGGLLLRLRRRQPAQAPPQQRIDGYGRCSHQAGNVQ